MKRYILLLVASLLAGVFSCGKQSDDHVEITRKNTNPRHFVPFQGSDAYRRVILAGITKGPQFEATSQRKYCRVLADYADSVGMELVSLEPMNANKRTGVRHYRILLETAGNWSDVVKFFFLIDRSDHILKIDKFSLTPWKAGSEGGNPYGKQFRANFEISALEAIQAAGTKQTGEGVVIDKMEFSRSELDILARLYCDRIPFTILLTDLFSTYPRNLPLDELTFQLGKLGLEIKLYPQNVKAEPELELERIVREQENTPWYRRYFRENRIAEITGREDEEGGLRRFLVHFISIGKNPNRDIEADIRTRRGFRLIPISNPFSPSPVTDRK